MSGGLPRGVGSGGQGARYGELFRGVGSGGGGGGQEARNGRLPRGVGGGQGARDGLLFTIQGCRKRVERQGPEMEYYSLLRGVGSGGGAGGQERGIIHYSGV